MQQIEVKEKNFRCLKSTIYILGVFYHIIKICHSPINGKVVQQDLNKISYSIRIGNTIINDSTKKIDKMS